MFKAITSKLNLPPDRGRMILAECAILAIAATIFMLHAMHYTSVIVDDAFITFRYVENFINGKGLVFNPGERVEGCSTLLFAFLLSALNYPLRHHPAMILETARMIGVVSGLLQLLLILIWARYLLKLPLYAAAVLLIALSLNTYFVYWSMNGLETSFYGLILLGTLTGFEAIRTARRRPRLPIVFLIVTAGSLLVVSARPEAIMYLFVYMLAVTASFAFKREWKTFFAWGLAGLTAVAFLFACRLAYYGDLLPNTYYAKYIDPSRRVCGVKYVKLFFGANWPAIAVHAIAAVGVLIGFRKALSIPLLIVIGSAYFAYRSNGDWMYNYRFIAPAIPCFLLLIVYGAHAIARAFGRKSKPLAWCFAAFFMVLFGIEVAEVARIDEWRPYFDERHWNKKSVFSDKQIAGPINPIVMRPQYLDYCRPGDWIMLPDTGLPSFTTQANVIDSQGLTDQAIAMTLYYKKKGDASAFNQWNSHIVDSVRTKNPLMFDNYHLWFVNGDERQYLPAEYIKVNDRIRLRADYRRLSYDEKKSNLLYACSHAPRIKEYGDLALKVFQKAGDKDGLGKMAEIYETYPGLASIAREARRLGSEAR